MLKKAKKIILIIIYVIISLILVLCGKKSGRCEINDVLTLFYNGDLKNDVSKFKNSSTIHLTLTYSIFFLFIPYLIFVFYV